MKRAALVLLLALGGCADEEIAPPPNQLLTAPELSHAREPRNGGDPPPPMREDLQKTRVTLFTQPEAAPIPTTTEAHRPYEGLVNPLQR